MGTWSHFSGTAWGWALRTSWNTVAKHSAQPPWPYMRVDPGQQQGCLPIFNDMKLGEGCL